MKRLRIAAPMKTEKGPKSRWLDFVCFCFEAAAETEAALYCFVIVMLLC